MKIKTTLFTLFLSQSLFSSYNPYQNLDIYDMANPIIMKELIEITEKIDKTRKEMLYNFVNSQDELGRTPLHYLLMKQDDNTAVILYKNGANQYIKDKKDKTPLDYLKN